MSALKQTGPYMPLADGAFRDWLVNFADRVNEDCYRYGLEPGDATVIQNLRISYEDAYNTVQQSSTRTPSAIAHKDAIKASAMASLRVYAGLIRANMGVDGQSRIELGLRLENPSRARIPAPASAPVLYPICAYPLVTCLRFADEASPTSRGKPWGVQFLQLAIAIAEPGQPFPTRPEQATRHEAVTKSPILIDHRPEDVGKQAVFWGRWLTGRGLTGPWSVSVNYTVAGGGGAIPMQAMKTIRAPELDALQRAQRCAA